MQGLNIEESLKETDSFEATVESTKYYKDNETSWKDVVDRFSPVWKDRPLLKSLLLSKHFIPAGSILAGFNVGKNRNSSLSNCYGIPIEHDNISSIGNTIRDNMLTFSWRGGVGNSFEVLRPKGAKVSNSAKTSTGSISFMPLFSNATNTIGQEGRRGASIFTHYIEHPDIIDFIKCKSHPEEVFGKDNLRPNYIPDLSGANLSVKLTDRFMNAVKNDDIWELTFPDIEKNKELYNEKWTGDYDEWERIDGDFKTYKKIPARELFDLLCKEGWNYAEPGVLFWDRAIEDTPMSCIPSLKIKLVNPCAEQILGNYQSCLLSSYVLYKFVKNPYTPEATFDIGLFKKAIHEAIIFMNRMIDYNTHPLQKQKDKEEYGRKIGIGFTGLADAMAMLGHSYGDKGFLEQLEKIMIFKAYWETYFSVMKAIDDGTCKALNENREKYASHYYFVKLDSDYAKLYNDKFSGTLTDLIKANGIRNIATSTIAPNGSLSIIADNCTSGIEPLFMLKYFRKSRIYDKQVTILHPVLLRYIKDNNPEDVKLSKEDLLKKYHYVEADSLDYKRRIQVQGIVQKYITDSISSTVNLPESATVEDISKLYKFAWVNNLKGITIYRSGCSLTGILTKDKEVSTSIIPLKQTLNSSESGKRYIIKWKGSKVYINVVEREGNPLEIFANLPYEAGLTKESSTFNQHLFMERQSYWNTITRLLSLYFRYGLPLDEILKCLYKSNYSITSLTGGLYRILTKYKMEDEKDIMDKCPSCGDYSLKKEGNCNICIKCGFSKCE